MKSPFQTLPLDESVGAMTVRELLARSHDGPIEILNDAGRTVIRVGRTVIRVDGDWLTFGERPHPGQASGGVTTEEFRKRLQRISAGKSLAGRYQPDAQASAVGGVDGVR